MLRAERISAVEGSMGRTSTKRRTHLVARALLALALVVATVSGAGFLVLVVHLNSLGGAFRIGGGSGLGMLFAPQLPCPSPTVAASAACVAAADPTSVPYSHSWYITNPDSMAELATRDALWLNQQSAGSTCGRDFLTVLDFAHPMRVAQGHASLLDDYGMSLFRHPTPATDREIEGIAERYLDAWIAAASSCPRLHLALGTSNFNECGGGVAGCDVYTAGQYWDVVAHDVMDYVAAKGYGSRVTGVWVADDLETSWDPWPTTLRFLQGVRDQERTYTTHAQLVNYGDANVGACSIVTGSCRTRWTAQNVYDAAWGLGWALPLPETYNADTTQLWDNVARAQGGPGAQGSMIFAGAMTECAGPDPLPSGPCRPQGGGVTGKGACEWSPTIAINHLRSTAAAPPANTTSPPTLYATNMQWPPKSSGDTSGGAPCS
jgi:hypothetical protein